MSPTKRRMFALCLPPVVAALVDMSLTLWGQSPEYWAGDYMHVNEMSGTMRSLLQVSPLAFLGGGAILILLFVTIIYLLPDTLALILSICQTIGSCTGATTWLLWHYYYGYQIANLMYLIAAVMLTISIRFIWQARPQNDFRPSIPAIWRWPLLALFLSIALYVAFRT